MRRLACALLLVLGCQEKSEKSQPPPPPPVPEVQPSADAAPPAVAITVEPSGATDAALAAIGKLLQPSAPVMGFAEIRPHLAPLAADCKEGSDIACAVFDNLYRYGQLVARKAPAHEVAVVEKACRADKDIAACALAGEARWDPKRPKPALELLGLACFQGLRRACARMARLRLEPGTEDPTLTEKRAHELLADVCKERDAEGCGYAGDPEALARACDLADFGSCAALIGKAGARARTARGLAIFQAACGRRHHPSCDAARTLSQKLRGAAP